MQLKLRSMQIISILAFSVSINAYADSWNCSNSDLVREVIIEYPEGGSVPCNVVYKKQTEGFEDQVLWSAESEEGYCAEKARDLVAKLESWGWVCLETVSSDMDEDTDTEQAEDTEQAVDEEPAADMEQVMDTEPAADTE
jgi:hypothetical protein